jgi:hypothetical protein
MTTIMPAPSTRIVPTPDAIDVARRRHWNSMARQWALLGPPLRPCAADIAVMEHAVQAEGQRCGERPLRALLFGVTPEIADMAWPARAELLAVDRSAEMLHAVWPGDRPGRRAVCGNWIETLAHAGPRDVVIGDGNLTTQVFPDEWERLARTAFEILSDHGVMIVRCRILPDVPESPADVFRELASRRIGSFHAFKLRLAMALQPAPGAGVRLDDVWRAWQGAGIDEQRLHAETGWPVDVIRTIDLYRQKTLRLTFPTREQTCAVFEDGFRLESSVEGPYELGDCNPILVCRRR